MIKQDKLVLLMSSWHQYNSVVGVFRATRDIYTHTELAQFKETMQGTKHFEQSPFFDHLIKTGALVSAGVEELTETTGVRTHEVV